jgi:hypothetical protein
MVGQYEVRSAKLHDIGLHAGLIHDTNRSKRMPTKIPLPNIKTDFQRLLYFHKARQWNATITLRDSAISIRLLANLIHGTNRSKRLQEKKPFNKNHNKLPAVALFSTLLNNEMQPQNCQTSWYQTAGLRNFDSRRASRCSCISTQQDKEMMQPRNRQKLQSKTHQHDSLIYVRQGATYLKLTCSVPCGSHSSWSTCSSKGPHSAPTSWTQIVAHTQIQRNETKRNETNRSWKRRVAKTTRSKTRGELSSSVLFIEIERRRKRGDAHDLPLHESWDTDLIHSWISMPML